MEFIIFFVLLCIGIGIVGGIVQETKPYRERKRLEKEWQERVQAQERQWQAQMQAQERAERKRKQEQIERCRDELDELYYQLNLLIKLEEVQHIDTNKKQVTELQIKKQIATQRQIYTIRKQIKRLESAIANLQAQM